MFGSCDDLLGLFSDFYVDDIGFAAFFLYGPASSMIAPVRHPLVDGCFEQYCHLVPNLIRSENSA